MIALLAESNKYGAEIARAWVAMFIAVTFIVCVAVVLVARMQNGKS